MPDERGSGQQQARSGHERVQASPNDAFVRHLEHASSVVQTWPSWMQEMLGGSASQQEANTPRRLTS